MMFNDINEIDSVLSRPVDSRKLARWERKKVQAMQSSSGKNFKTPDTLRSPLLLSPFSV
jgi:hypothetical protein